MQKLIYILLLSVATLASATIYQWQDASGTTHFSDRPTVENAKQLKLAIETVNTGSFYSVKRVYDGDTIELEDGRKIRFLGINTPEISHRGKSADMGGDTAKIWLENKLNNTKVRLEFDAEPTDHYGRTLAYVFTEKGENINVQLVAEGLAAVSIYPPNLRYVEPLINAENIAEKAGLGVWQLTQYAVISANQISIDGDYNGWTRINGTLQSVRETKKYTYLNFTDNFSVRIDNDNKPLFPDLNSYRNKTVEVRGWLNKSKRGLSMLIRHPSAIKEH